MSAATLHQRAARLHTCGSARVAHSRLLRRALAPARSSSNGDLRPQPAAPAYPPAAETARTVIHISSEGTLSTLLEGGMPFGSTVPYTLDASGQPIIRVPAAGLEHQCLTRNPSCSLHITPTAYPARAVAAVTLVGRASLLAATDDTFHDYHLSLDKCYYSGGLDQTESTVVVEPEEFKTAEPDLLREAANEVVITWNGERAEDIYRIVSDFLGVQLTEMVYAELVWLDRLGMYIRAEVMGGAPQVVRVPFIRPVTDERDARSALTMAAQVAWERERTYAPNPIPAFAGDAANN